MARGIFPVALTPEQRYQRESEELDELTAHRRDDANSFPEYRGTVRFRFLDKEDVCNGDMLVGAKAYYYDKPLEYVMHNTDAVKGWSYALAGAFILRDGFPLLNRTRCVLLNMNGGKSLTGIIDDLTTHEGRRSARNREAQITAQKNAADVQTFAQTEYTPEERAARSRDICGND